MSQRGRCFPDGPFTHPLNHQDPQSHLHWPLGSSSTVKPLTLSPGLLCFQARLNVSHSEFLNVGEQILYGCSWITVKNCQGKYDQVDSFSDIHFLFFWSSVSYLWHLSTFLCFPWVSFCEGIESVAFKLAAWGLLEAWLGPVEGGRRVNNAGFQKEEGPPA